MNMPEWLREIDTRILLAINGAHDPLLDFVLYWASNKWTWIPFYVWLLYVLYRNYSKKVLWFLPLIVLMISGSDQLSTLIKNATERLRPCHEPGIYGMVHLVNNACGGQYGFVSSHAANSMALAVFIFLLLPRGYKDLRLELVAFVLINGYSRIYLGAHYPLDIVCGWILGFILGLIFSSLMKYLVKVPDKVATGHE